MIPAKSLYVTQPQKTQSESPVAMVVRQPDQPVGDFCIFVVELGFITVAVLADGHDVASQPNRNSFVRH